jgi:CrcB protein
MYTLTKYLIDIEVLFLNLLSIALGGFLGSVSRYALGEWIHLDNFPIGTLFVNLTGCFLIGWFFTIVVDRIRLDARIRLGVGTGFIGSLTTFSTFSVETVNLIEQSQFVLASVYVLSSVLVGLVLVALGCRAAAGKQREREESL